MKKITLFLVSLVFAGALLAQNVQVSGVVTDTDGQPLPGVSVVVKGTRTSATTDVNGRYAISAPADAVLEFSSLGLTTREVATNGRAAVDVVLESDAVNLDEIIITGVGAATDKRKVAIAVESVKNIDKLPANSIDAALSGKIAGAQIQSISGQPGVQSTIILRGINSLGSTQPMILVDGVQINAGNNTNGGTASSTNMSSRFADLDLSNVERVEVVQGAAAATIYGAQGANGVIQIFTKRGRAGEKLKITYNGRMSIDNAITGGFKQSQKHFFRTDAEGYILAGSTGDRIAVDKNTGFWTQPLITVDGTTVSDKAFKETTYDHLEQLFKQNVVSWNHALNISGAGAKTDYSINLSNTNQNGIIQGNLNRTNLSTNIGVELFKNFKLRSSTQIITSKNTTGGINGANNIYSGLGFAMLHAPYVNLEYKDSLGNYFVNDKSTDNAVSPFYSQQFQQYTAKLTRIIQGVEASYSFPKFVELNYKYGIDNYRYDFTNYLKNQGETANPTMGIAPLNGQMIYDLDNETMQNSLLSAFLRFDFEKDFGWLPIKSVTQFSYDWRNVKYTNNTTTGTGLPTVPPISMGFAENYAATEYNREFTTFGYLINQRFDYANLAGLSVGFRSDYSSAFGAGSDPFFFPRGDVYFRFSELIGSPIVQELKLRAAYGEAGIQPGAYDRLITLGSYLIDGKNLYYIPDVSTNPNLGVEISKELEVGLDYAFTTPLTTWLTRFSGAITYWDKKSEGSIRSLDVAPSTGAVGILDNAIDLKSHGLQFSLDINVLSTRDFNWTFGTRFGFQRTVVDRISNHMPIVIGSGGNGQTVIKEGEPVGAFFGFRPVKTLDEKDSKGEYYIDPANVSNYEVVNGMVVNKTTKKVEMTTEQEKIGDATPKFNMSFFHDLAFKGINLSMQIDWVQGAQAYNQSRQFMYRDYTHPDFEQPVTINGETKAYTAYYNSLYHTNQINGYFVEDASFVRLRDVTISYDFNRLAKLDFIQSMTLSLSGRNLFTITNYSGLDPEATGTRLNNPLYRGIDLWNFPNTKSFIVGLNIAF